MRVLLYELLSAASGGATVMSVPGLRRAASRDIRKASGARRQPARRHPRSRWAPLAFSFAEAAAHQSDGVVPLTNALAALAVSR